MTGARFALLLVAAALLAAPAISTTSTTSPTTAPAQQASTPASAPAATPQPTPEEQGATTCAAGVEAVQAQAGTIDAPVCDDAFQASTPARERE